MKAVKTFIAIIIFLFTINIAFAEIVITLNSDEFNLGDQIEARTVAVLQDDVQGFYKLRITCDSYSLDYYITPVTVTANNPFEVESPGLPVSASMIGECAIVASVKDDQGSEIESKSSGSITVTDKLKLFLEVDSREVSPGQKIKVEGQAKKVSSGTVDNAVMTAALDGNHIKRNVNNGEFNFEINLDEEIKSGRHNLVVLVEDDFNNKGEDTLRINVAQVPKNLVLVLNTRSFDPGSKLTIQPDLLDQAGDLLPKEVKIQILDPSGNLLETRNLQGSEIMEYNFDLSAKPGEYKIKASYGNLESQDTVSVRTIKDIDVSIEDDTVTIKNTGNVDYFDEATIVVEDKERKYIINKKLELSPGQTTEFDLGEEVPGGTYDITLPTNEVSQVEVEDKRSIFKKITGRITASNSEINQRRILLSSLAFILLSFYLAIVIFRFKKKRKDLFSTE